MKLIDTLKRIREIAETLPDDDPDKLEMLNTEADFNGLMEWALTKRNESLALAEANKELSGLYEKRKKSFEGKANQMKDIVGWILHEAKETKFKGASATVSITRKPPALVVTDETKIPGEYFKTERTLMKAELNKAFKEGKSIAGTTLSNGGETIMIRSK